MRTLILGASGLIGSTMLKIFSEKTTNETIGTIRDNHIKQHFPKHLTDSLIPDVDMMNMDALSKLFHEIKPDVVINCTGVTKHLKQASDPTIAISMNALLPHQLSNLCKKTNARFIQISTDCVFSGSKGNYIESDFADVDDLYGRSKFLGEVHQPHSITIRTSTIGHELTTKYGLLEWFLSQTSQCKGFKQAYFSGLPTVELARVIRDHVTTNKHLTGLYHVGAASISKYDLLKLIAKTYNKEIDITADEKFIIDRSLNSSQFTKATGYSAPTWPELIKDMHDQHITEGL